MSQIAIDDPKTAVRYLESVRLPVPPGEFEGLRGEELPPAPAYTSDVDQAVTIGSQIAEAIRLHHGVDQTGFSQYRFGQ